MERFVSILIEHYAGNFPVWLAPVQATVLPVSDAFNGYAERATAALRAAGLRAESDLRSEKVGYKIRQAELQKVPYMLVVGAKEAETGAVAVRRHGHGAQETLPLGAAIEAIRADVAAGMGGPAAAA